MRRFARDNGLSLVFLGIFLAALFGQSVAGHHEYNEEARQHGEAAISYGRYLVSSHFGVEMLENWESEYLQFFLFILATIWLVQRGSNESKAVEDVGLESDEQQQVGRHARPDSPGWAKAGGWRTHVYANSLLAVMGVIFLASWIGQAVTGWNVYKNEQKEHKEPPVSFTAYLGRADFWDRTFQNWQSEFLAVGTMAAFTIYLRQRGSPESKPVGSPHDETAASG